MVLKGNEIQIFSVKPSETESKNVLESFKGAQK